MGEYFIVGMAYLGWIGLTARLVSDTRQLVIMVVALMALCAFTVQML